MSTQNVNDPKGGRKSLYAKNSRWTRITGLPKTQKENRSKFPQQMLLQKYVVLCDRASVLLQFLSKSFRQAMLEQKINRDKHLIQGQVKAVQYVTSYYLYPKKLCRPKKVPYSRYYKTLLYLFLRLFGASSIQEGLIFKKFLN